MLLAALVPALAAATALSLWRPSLALRIWIALLPVQLDTGGSLGLRLAPADVLLAGMIVAILARKLPHRRLSLRVDAVLVVALLLLVWLVLSLPQTVAELGYVPRSVLVNKLVGFALLAAVYWMTLESHSTAKEAIKALDWYRTAGSLWNLVGIGAFTIWQRFGVLSPFVYGGTRLCGLLVDPNAYRGHHNAVTFVFGPHTTSITTVQWPSRSVYCLPMDYVTSREIVSVTFAENGAKTGSTSGAHISGVPSRMNFANAP